MTLFRMLRQILRCLDGSLVNVLYDVLMSRYVTVIRCPDGRQLPSTYEGQPKQRLPLLLSTSGSDNTGICTFCSCFQIAADMPKEVLSNHRRTWAEPD
jgi:hypothetical protein